jgi:hypothetical protein
MENLSILKIESTEGQLLSTGRATQEVTPVAKGKINRTIDCRPLIQSDQRISKLRCIIETEEPPDSKLLRLHGQFTIYSIVRFRWSKSLSEHPPNCIDDSIEDHGAYITFRPVLNMFLTNFSCKCNNSISETWKLEFEEV